MVQLSMDGPNTNWEVFDLLNRQREEERWSTLLNLGSCELHVVHGGFQTGVKATDWEIEKVLRVMWNIFHDSPAGREMYTRVGVTDVFPYVTLCQNVRFKNPVLYSFYPQKL